MLRIYDVALEVVKELGPIVEAIGRRNRNLADQLDRDSMAVPLAIAEGAWARGGNRNVAYQRAAAKMRQVVGTLVNVLR